MNKERLASAVKAFDEENYLVNPEKPKHLPKIGTLEAIKGYNNNQ